VYSNPTYYFLLLISFLIFVIYLISVKRVMSQKDNFEFFDIATIDETAYWVYNNKLYYARINNEVVDKETISTLDTFGMQAKEAHEMFRNFK
jgi:hypothetical protein